MFNKYTKTTASIMLPMASLLMLAVYTSDAEASPVTNQIDLSQTEDLFAQPIKPNPLTTDPAAVVVRVNGEEITRGEILQAMAPSLQQIAGKVPPDQLQQVQANLYKNMQDSLIAKKLLDAAVVASKTEVTEEELASTLTEIRASVPPGQDFETALAAQGTTLEEFTRQIKEQLITKKFLDTKIEGIADATEAEAKEFYDTNPDKFQKPENITASHILIKFEKVDTDEIKAEKKTKLEKIRTDIIAGTISFEDAAKANSECPSGKEGGALGSFAKGQMVPEFELAALSQEKDEVGDIIETQFGYHIIKTTDHQEASVVSFDESKERIIAYLGEQKKQETVAAYIKSLKDSATIEMVTM